jgi:hypothetical protein
MVATRGKQGGSTAVLKARHTTGGLPAWELGQVHATGTRAADPRRAQLAAYRVSLSVLSARWAESNKDQAPA